MSVEKQGSCIRKNVVSEHTKLRCKIYNKDIRDRRRVQYTMLTFLYAYERNLSIDVIKFYSTKRIKAINCTDSFYRLYNFVSEDGRLYHRALLSECGKKLLHDEFEQAKENMNKTKEDINCINYFLIKKLNINLSTYTSKMDVRRNTPFIDIDMKKLLENEWRIDFCKFYKMIDIAIEKNMEMHKLFGTRYGPQYIDSDEVKKIVNLSMIDGTVVDSNIMDDTPDSGNDSSVKPFPNVSILEGFFKRDDDEYNCVMERCRDLFTSDNSPTHNGVTGCRLSDMYSSTSNSEQERYKHFVKMNMAADELEKRIPMNMPMTTYVIKYMNTNGANTTKPIDSAHQLNTLINGFCVSIN